MSSVTRDNPQSVKTFENNSHCRDTMLGISDRQRVDPQVDDRETLSSSADVGSGVPASGPHDSAAHLSQRLQCANGSSEKELRANAADEQTALGVVRWTRDALQHIEQVMLDTASTAGERSMPDLFSRSWRAAIAHIEQALSVDSASAGSGRVTRQRTIQLQELDPCPSQKPDGSCGHDDDLSRQYCIERRLRQVRDVYVTPYQEILREGEECLTLHVKSNKSLRAVDLFKETSYGSDGYVERIARGIREMESSISMVVRVLAIDQTPTIQEMMCKLRETLSQHVKHRFPSLKSVGRSRMENFFIFSALHSVLRSLVELGMQRIKEDQESSKFYADVRGSYPRVSNLQEDFYGQRIAGTCLSFNELIHLRNLLFSRNLAYVFKARAALNRLKESSAIHSDRLAFLAQELDLGGFSIAEREAFFFSFDLEGKPFPANGEAGACLLCPNARVDLTDQIFLSHHCAYTEAVKPFLKEGFSLSLVQRAELAKLLNIEVARVRRWADFDSVYDTQVHLTRDALTQTTIRPQRTAHGRLS